jgi:hypothetical protein
VPDLQSHNPDDADVLTLQDFFHRAFGSASPLHQKLALGLTVLLAYSPRQIVEELSDQPFDLLTQRLSSDYPAGGRLSAWIHRTTSPLEAHLRRDPGLAHSTFEASYTGQTIQTRRADISRWTFDIRKRTIAAKVLGDAR